MGAGVGQHQRQRHRRMPAATAAAFAILWLAWAQTSSSALINERPGNVLTMILTDCAKYQDWQTIAAAFAWRQSGQPGSVIRVANCNQEDTKKYSKKMLDYVETHMAKQYAWYAPLKDWYAAYNKPGAVVDYFEHFPHPKEEWVVILDSDMLLKTPFLPEELPLERGWAYAAHYDYLVGVNNDLAMRHVREVEPRNDTTAGPAGRRGDRVGGPYYMHRDDLKKLAPQWLNYTHIMRDDFEAYKDSGDTASKKGDRIWIAEMYGYSFGAAKTNIWHKWQHDFMLYPTYTPSAVPHVMHYGLVYKVGDWEYDKHWYFDFDVHKCPPWNLSGKPKAGIFPPPPHPDKLPNKEYLTQYRDLLSVSVIATVNAAMCDYHVRNCPPSPQLTEVCDEAFKLYHDIDTQVKEHEWRWGCTDHNKECRMWAERGECKNSKQYMIDHCQVSCKYCTPKSPRPKSAVEEEPLTVARISKEVGVTPAQPGSGGATSAAAADDEVAKKAAMEKAAADKAAADKAVADKAAADKASADKAAADKAAAAEKAAAASKAAAEAAAAAKAAAAAAAAKVAEGPSEEELRGKYPGSTLTYAALVKRCTGLHGLDDASLKVCLKAAGYKLLYPGIDAATGGADGAAAAAAGATAQQLKGNSQPAEGHALDLAALHARVQGSRSRVENMLSRTGVTEDSWSFAEQALVLLAVFGLGVFSYSRYTRYKAGKAKDHRSE